MFIIIKTSFSVSKLVTRRPKMTRQLVGNVNSTPVAEKVVTPGTVHFIAAVDSLYGCEASRTHLNFQTSIIKLTRYTLTAKMCKVSAFTQSCLEQIGQVARLSTAFLKETTVSQSGVGHHLALVASCVVYSLYFFVKS